ncbi:DUF6691 family protein [Sphingobacterium psychroaquaticum]|uniref:Uncharacterized protein n=1 Tax=Sphingobacterium psychroaquaticum TaxID=561061 RepID=A0A1X7J0D2_9SPHI|nr:DUF6691 family protein [Sphingobacterium psychroaquaticum]QBQ40206.1 YeeE/YedE family protein [Sphingobacterium psychroaquaticum]SMG20906.1 hypothetical protein SAMN05660862_1304 [Sphingobacterium psychroaquaticum]
MKRLIYILLGVLFGMAMYKAEAASWFRIYEMFNFQSIHMYGFIATALLIGVIGIQWMKRSGAKDIDGQVITIKPKSKTIPRYLIGGIFFGMGWALVGACPGPVFVLIGAGVFPMLVVAIFALAGTYLYGMLKDKLPH